MSVTSQKVKQKKLDAKKGKRKMRVRFEEKQRSLTISNKTICVGTRVNEC